MLLLYCLWLFVNCQIGTIHKHFINVKSPEVSNCPVHEVFKIKVHGMSNLFSNNLGKNIHQQRQKQRKMKRHKKTQRADNTKSNKGHVHDY